MDPSITDIGLFRPLCGRFDAERARGPLWLPVAFGLGIRIYFSLPQEPPHLAGPALLTGLLAIFLVVRGLPLPFLLSVLAIMVVLGFVAVRTGGGAVHISEPRAAPFVRDLWQRRMGVDGFVAFFAATGGADTMLCDPLGCLGLAGGRVVAVVSDARAFEEDCRVAQIMIAQVPIPPSCGQQEIRIGRFDLWCDGAHAVWLAGGEPRVWQARIPHPLRPWMRPV